MAEIKKRKGLQRGARDVAANAGAAPAAQMRSSPSPLKKPESEVARKIFDAPIHEPAREELDPLSCLLFDANLYLNGYLEALKALNEGARQPKALGEGSMKGIGAA